MVDQIKGASPHELFQEIKSINDEAVLLNERLAVLRKLKDQVSGHLCALSYSNSNLVPDRGLVYLDETPYVYALDLDLSVVADFYPLSVIEDDSIIQLLAESEG